MAMETWNMGVGLSAVGRKAVSYAAAQYGLSIRAWGAPVVEAGARLVVFGDYLREIVESGESISRAASIQFVRCVAEFQIAAEPHPRRIRLTDEETGLIAEHLLTSLNQLLALDVGRERLNLRPVSLSVDAEITLCLSREVHALLQNAAAVSQSTKRELAQDLLESAGVMARVAGLKRQSRLCGDGRVSAQEIIDTWVGMLVAARCLSADDKSRVASSGFRTSLFEWYDRHSHRGIEALEVDLNARPAFVEGSMQNAPS